MCLWVMYTTYNSNVCVQEHAKNIVTLMKTKFFEYGLYLELCRYECSSGSESQNIVIGHLYGSWCKEKFKVQGHLVGLG